MSKFDFLKGFKKISISRIKLPVIIAVIVAVILAVMAFNSLGSGFSFGFGVAKDKIAAKALDYINKNLLSNGQTATLVSASVEGGVVKLKIKVNNSEFDSYVTKDGKLLFPQAFDMDKKTEDTTASNSASSAPTEEQIKQTCKTLPKNDKPVLDAYIVSKCPYGLQMQRILADVAANAPALAQNIMVRYIGSISNGNISSMHGTAEAQENLRQICIRDEQRSKYWNYISCHIKAGDVDSCLASAGIDTNKLATCISDKNRGLAYAKEDFDLNTQYGVQGSPTLILDGKEISEFNFGGRTSDALKTMICCAYNSQPGICSTKLNTSNAASSFSETYSSSNGASGDANCE